MTNIEYDMRNDLVPKKLAIAMWDYSWIYGHYTGGPFEDFDIAMDQLIERGFNTVRIDCCPLLIGMLEHDEQRITIPGGPLNNWGVCDVDREHYLIKELVEFMRAAKRKGIYVILSTWNLGCKEFLNIRDNYAGKYSSFCGAWEKTINILKKQDLLEHVVYVDMDQEFPYHSPFVTELNALAQNRNDGDCKNVANAMEEAGKLKNSDAGFAWNSAQMAYVKSLFINTLTYFQSLYPYLRFTYSLTSFWEEVRAMKLKCFDVLELHIWIHSERFESRVGFEKITKDRGEHDYNDYQRRIDDAMHSMRPMFKHDMHRKLLFAKEWANEISAPLTTTEAWGPWWHMDHPDLKWKWLEDWCAECNHLAAQYGLWGSTPWNYSHPYWKNWSNISWYNQVNESFIKG